MGNSLESGSTLHYQTLSEKMRAARGIFPSNLKQKSVHPSVQHDGSQPLVPAMTFLQESGVNPEELAEMFGRKNEWRFPSFPYPLDTPHTMFDRQLKEHLLGINRGIGRSLDGQSEMGFNKHGDGHASRVTKFAEDLVRMSMQQRGEIATDFDLNCVSVAGRAHDLGNLLSRSLHNLVSARMLERIFPSVVQHQRVGKQLRRAIIFHPSDKLRVLTRELWKSNGSEDRWKRMRETFGTFGLAMIAADKIDIGRERISDRADADAIVKDPHAEVNHWGKNNGFKLSEDGKELNWYLVYTPSLSNREIKRYPNFASEMKNQIPRPFQRWIELFHRLYAKRMVTFADCAFALFPDLDHVDIVFNEGRDQEGGYFVRFPRDNFDAVSDAFLENNKHR